MKITEKSFLVVEEGKKGVGKAPPPPPQQQPAPPSLVEKARLVEGQGQAGVESVGMGEEEDGSAPSGVEGLGGIVEEVHERLHSADEQADIEVEARWAGLSEEKKAAAEAEKAEAGEDGRHARPARRDPRARGA